MTAAIPAFRQRRAISLAPLTGAAPLTGTRPRITPRVHAKSYFTEPYFTDMSGSAEPGTVVVGSTPFQRSARTLWLHKCDRERVDAGPLVAYCVLRRLGTACGAGSLIDKQLDS